MAKTTKIMALCAVLAAGCTTQFDKDDATTGDGTDTGGDTAGDVPVDVPGDTPVDGEPDGTPPPVVDCRVVRDVENRFGDGTNIPYGCDTSGFCLETAIWISEQDANIIVIHGTEETVLDPGVHLLAHMLGVGDLRMRGEMPIPDSVPYETFIRTGSLVERLEDRAVLVVPAVDEFGTGGPLWNIRRVEVQITGTDSMDYDEAVLLEPGVPQSTGALLYPRGVPQPGGAVHLLVLLTSVESSEKNWLHGATLTGSTFDRGGIPFAGSFHPLQPDMGGPFYPGRIDVSEGTLVMPYTEIDTVDITIRAGLWVHHGAFTSTSAIHSLLMQSDRNITAGVAGTFIGPATYGSAAVTSDSDFAPEAPLAPPYQVGSRTLVGEMLDAASVAVRDVFEEVDLVAGRDQHTWDPTDIMVLHDPTTGFHFYVLPLYEGEGQAFVGIFPLREDGSEGGPPLLVPTGQNVLPAFDATINPETGAIYLVRHMETESGPDDISNVPGFMVTEVSCPVAE